jgi:cell division protein FtsZ
VIGVGDAGGHAVEGVLGGTGGEGTLAVVNTDPVALAASHAMTKVQIGSHDDSSGGTAGDPLIGKAAAERDIEMIRGLFTDCDALILAVGLGGGTGTGASPVVLKAARSAGVLTLVVATMPFGFEGESRRAVAQSGLQAISPVADFLSVVENDHLFAGAAPDGDITVAFAKANEALAGGICGLWHMLSQPLLMGVDSSTFAGMTQKGSGVCRFGFGVASGNTRVDSVVKAIKDGPIFEKGEGLRASGAALICVCGSHDMTVQDVSDLVNGITSGLADGTDVQIAAVINEAWRNRILGAVWLSDRRRTVKPVTRPTTRSGKTKRPVKQKPEQEELKFDITGGSRGRFNNIAATVLDGEDLDTPTYKRRGIVLEK